MTHLHIRRLALKTLVVTAAISAVGIFPRKLSAETPTVAPAVTDVVQATKLPGTIRQQEWLKATVNQRIKLSEQLGEDGARTLAKEKGWAPLLDGTCCTLRQGFDQVYEFEGVTNVVEAKGGSGQLDFSYGYNQASPEWATKAAERTLKSPAASDAEKSASRAVLKAAQNGKLQVDVVRASHVLGEPTTTVIEQTACGTKGTAELAMVVTSDLAKCEAAASVDSIARTLAVDTAETIWPMSEAASVTSTLGKGVSTAALPLAVAIDASLRVDKSVQIEHQFAAGDLTQQQREIEHAKNAASMAGGWLGAWGGAKIGLVGGAAAGTCIEPGAGTGVGGTLGAVAGGIGGYYGGQVVAENGAAWAVSKVHQSGTTVAAVASSTVQTGKHVVAATKEDWNWTAETATSAASATGTGCKNGLNWTKEKTISAADATGTGCKTGWNWTASKANASWAWARTW